MKGQDNKMTYEEIVGKALIVYAKADATEVTGHLAVQFNVRGEGEGAFYIEVSDGKVDIQPYEYYDRNAIVTVNSDVLIEMLDGKLGIDEAYNDNKVQIEGDLGAALLLKKIAVKKAPEKTAEAKEAAKAPAKKTTAKKTTAKRTTTKKASSKTTEAKAATGSKTTATKKATTKSTAAKKTTKAAK